MVGSAAVTTNYANCTACAAGEHQPLDSEIMNECAPCFPGSYAAGAHVTDTLVSLSSRTMVVIVALLSRHHETFHCIARVYAGMKVVPWQGPATLCVLSVMLDTLQMYLVLCSARRAHQAATWTRLV